MTKTLYTKILLALTLSLLVFSQAQAQESLTFYVVDYPPHIIIENDGESITGMDIDLVSAVFATQDINVQFKSLPWKRTLKALKHGSIVGTSSCSRRSEREEFLYFSGPLSYVKRAVLSRQKLDTSDLSSVQQLSDYSVVSVADWGMQKELEKLNIEHSTTPDIISAVKAVRYRNVDVLYMAEYPAYYYANILGVSDDLKVTVLDDEPVLPLYICISKNYPNAAAIYQAAQNGLAEIQANGVVEQIRARYQ